MVDFFRQYLVIDWWEEPTGADENFVLAPATVGQETGTRTESWPDLAPCVFLTPDNKCKIHAVKPQECRMTRACTPRDEDELSERSRVADAWRNPVHQAMIEKLSGD